MTSKIKKFFILLCIIVLVSFSAACSNKVSTEGQVPLGGELFESELFSISGLNKSVNVGRYVIAKFEIPQRFYAVEEDVPIEVDYQDDGTGIPVYIRNNQRFFHPVVLAQQGLRQLAGFYFTDESKFLKRSVRIANALKIGAHWSRGAMWFPYHFSFALHGNVDETAAPPWYSGMAQGQALSLFSRLFEATSDSQYLSDASAIFNSLALVGISAEPWVTRMSGKFLWIEEYPTPVQDETLNGFLFAIFGIYDYWLVTDDPRAHLLLQASIATIDHFMESFRIEGQISSYCLAHKVQSERYHEVHIEQLSFLARISSEPRFQAWSDLLASDH
jgi:hypothetical protein